MDAWHETLTLKDVVFFNLKIVAIYWFVLVSNSVEVLHDQVSETPRLVSHRSIVIGLVNCNNELMLPSEARKIFVLRQDAQLVLRLGNLSDK